MNDDRIYRALVVNDYQYQRYATWIKSGKKCVETRMKKIFTHRGPVVICVGASNSVGPNIGKAICMVDIWKGRDMVPQDAEGACIEWHPDRKAHLLDNWQYFSEDFNFAKCAVKKNFQGLFSLRVPDHIQLIPQPQIKPLYQYVIERDKDK